MFPEEFKPTWRNLKRETVWEVIPLDGNGEAGVERIPTAL